MNCTNQNQNPETAIERRMEFLAMEINFLAEKSGRFSEAPPLQLDPECTVSVRKCTTGIRWYTMVYDGVRLVYDWCTEGKSGVRQGSQGAQQSPNRDPPSDARGKAKPSDFRTHSSFVKIRCSVFKSCRTVNAWNVSPGVRCRKYPCSIFSSVGFNCSNEIP